MNKIIWTKKTVMEKIQDEANKRVEQERHFEKIFLVQERQSAEVWALCLGNPAITTPYLVALENLIREGCTLRWGDCSFEMDRIRKKIFVEAQDGKCIELVSGEQFFKSLALSN